jgi:hypothetical protein
VAAALQFICKQPAEVSTVVVIVRASLHVGLNSKAMAAEFNALFAALGAVKSKRIIVMYVNQHGNGKRKPARYLPSQGTASLAAFDKHTLEQLSIPGAVTFLNFSCSHLFQAAERACDAVYESPDGTHMSLSVQVGAVRLIHSIIADTILQGLKQHQVSTSGTFGTREGNAALLSDVTELAMPLCSSP